MSDRRWNENIVLYPTDRLFKQVFAPFIPRRVLPNHLTVLRLCLVPFVIILLVNQRYGAGTVLFLIAALTDWFDGALARTRSQISEWGIMFDPLVDKLLIGSMLFVIVLQHVNYALGIALLLVEGFMILAGLWQKGRGVIEPANMWGKMKMVAEVCGVLLLLLALWFDVNLLVDLSTGTLAVALVFALLSIFYRMR